MTQIINLNKTRKAKAKVVKEKTAAQNRVQFGRTKAEKQVEATRVETLHKLVDGHKLTPKEDSTESKNS